MALQRGAADRVCAEASLSRSFALLLLLIFYIWGAYHAYRAMSVERHALPTVAEAQFHTAFPAAAAARVAARGLCAPRARLHLAQLAGARPTIDAAWLAEGHVQPLLAALIGGAAGATPVVSSSRLLFPPPLPSEHLRWHAELQAHVLPAAPADAWARQLNQAAWSHAAGSSGEAPEAAAAPLVLIFSPLPHHQPVLLETPDGSHGSSLQPDEGSLILLVPGPQQLQPSNDSSGGWSGGDGIAGNGSSGMDHGNSGRGTAEKVLAGAILTWLLQPLEGSSSSGSGSRSNSTAPVTLHRLRRRLAAACAADASAGVQRFVAAATAAPNQPVSAAAGEHAARAVDLLRQAAAALAADVQGQRQQHGQQQQGSEAEAEATAAAALAAAFGAWAAAWALQSDAHTGAHPAFPPEHSLAVLLPLALPVTLVLSQAVGRQVAGWRTQRQAGAGRSGLSSTAAGAGAVDVIGAAAAGTADKPAEPHAKSS